MVAEIEAFKMNLVTMTNGDGKMAAGRTEGWTVILTMVRVIWRDTRKVKVDTKKAYGFENTSVVVGQCRWGALQAHIVMNEFMRSQIRQHLEVAPHIKLYLFEHRAPREEVLVLKQNVEAQAKTISQIENTCRDLLTEKANSL